MKSILYNNNPLQLLCLDTFSTMFEGYSKNSQEITRILGHHVYDKVSLAAVNLELDKSHQPVTKLIYGRRIFNFRLRIFPVLVNANEQAPCFTILRNYDDFVELDTHIHTCPGMTHRCFFKKIILKTILKF